MESLQQKIERLNVLLRTRRFGRKMCWLDAVDSTNTVAASWAKEGAGTGALVVADFQRRGRGRFDRSWTADPGDNLTFSLIFDAEEAGSNLGLLPIVLAIAVAETIGDHIIRHRPMIKWPNDVIVAGRKACGILIETSIPSRSDSRSGYAVAGIGLNVNQKKFSNELAVSATSLYQLEGRETDRVQLLSELLLAIEDVYERLLVDNSTPLIRRYESRMIGLDKLARFSIFENGVVAEGSILGIDATGALRVLTTNGVKTVRAGEVTFSSEESFESRIPHVPESPRS